MSDRKSFQKSKLRRRRVRGKQVSLSVSLGINKMIYKTRWEFGLVSSGTSGTIAVSNISPSIVNSSEYSTVSSLFSEVKLLRCQIVITQRLQGGEIVSRLMVGTQMQANQSVPGTVTSISNVQNLARLVYITIGAPSIRPVHYNMVVPRSLDYASITADAPSPVTPWAGSPGCIYMWANNTTASADYFHVDVLATYMLRGRV